MQLVLGDHRLVHVRMSANKIEHNTESNYKVNLIRTKLRISICALPLSLILIYVILL